MNLNLSTVEPEMLSFAKQRIQENDLLGVMAFMPNTRRLAFVVDNHPLLKERGLYEEALLDAYIATRINFSQWSWDLIKYLFEIADRKRLLSLGDPLPGDGPFTVYRGISGKGAARRIRGISWTGDLEKAIWFAKRFSLEKPTVFKAIISKDLVFVYTNDRKESEFLCDIPRDLKLKKVWVG